MMLHCDDMATPIAPGLDNTIVPSPLLSHKPVRGWAIFLLLTTLAVPRGAWGQAAPADTFTRIDAVIVGLSAGLYWAPDVFGIEAGPPDCLPCDRASLPSFDRFSVAEVRPFWDDLSTVFLFGLAAATWLDLMVAEPRARESGRSQIVASAESAVLAVGVTVLLKEVVGRNRPVLYTDGAAGIADPAAQTRSWPSGHTSTAFALATSYVLSQSKKGTGVAARVGVLGVAAATGLLRVAAARHFPSDVVSGAAIGIGSALLVHAIRF